MSVTVERAFDGLATEIKVEHHMGNIIPEVGLDQLLNLYLRKALEAAKRKLGCFKYYSLYEASFKRNIDSDAQKVAFYTKTTVCFLNQSVNDALQQCRAKVLHSLDEFESKGSGWIFQHWNGVTIKVIRYQPLSGASYIPTPPPLKNRRCLLNIKNKDNLCFLYAVAAAYKTPKRNQTRPGFYKGLIHRFDMSGIPVPVKLEDIPKFEYQNHVNVNVFSYSEHGSPTYITPLQPSSYNFDKTVNLLLIHEDSKSHYLLIKSLPTLLRLLTKHLKTRHTCDRCYRVFESILTYMRHCNFCQTGEPTITMPDEPTLKFKNYHRKLENPVTIYADFEAFQESITETISDNTKLICEQKPSGFAYIVSSPFPELCKPVKVYRGPDASEVFVNNLLDECEDAGKILNVVKPMIFTPEDESIYRNATICHICQKPLDWKSGEVCRDHCHITGSFRGAAHTSCNIALQLRKRIIVYFHNAKGYDNHFLIESMAANPKIGNIDVLGPTPEKYTRIATSQFVVHDSMSHLIGSLDNLCASLRQRGEDGFNWIRQEFPDEEKFKCALRKLVYPYDYIDGFSRFEEKIPDRSKFYNKLNESDLPEDEYERLLETCKVFGIGTLGELHDLYLKIDVLILCCVFEDYRRLGMEMFRLDPAYYISSPSYSFDAMLHTTNVELELLQSVEMYNFFERGMRGGCSSIFKRLATANNEAANFNYDPRCEQSSLFYTDCNNLYGACMLMKLPYSEFRWMSESELNALNVGSFNCAGDYGAVLEVDIIYPDHLHEEHRDFPLAPEKRDITKEMLSDEMQAFLERNDMKFTTQNRLTQTFLPKERYVCHIKNLQFYQSQGLIITKVHRGVIFFQKAWMKEYILTNTLRRIQARSKFEKDFFKLLINSIFGKTCENVRRYRTFKIVKSAKQAKKYLERVEFKNYTTISSNLMVIELEKTEVLLNKPIYAGMAILDLAKDHMFRFHYSIMKPLFPNKIEVCFSDTDSLCYFIKEGDITSRLATIRQYMDFSNYDESHPLYSVGNKCIPGKFKDEVAGDTIIQFCGHRAKSYSMVTLKDQKMAVAGVKRSKRHCLKHVDFVDVIASASLKTITQRTLTSKKHRIFMQESNRIALSYFDIKRFVLGNGIDTVPYGYRAFE